MLRIANADWQWKNNSEMPDFIRQRRDCVPLRAAVIWAMIFMATLGLLPADAMDGAPTSTMKIETLKLSNSTCEAIILTKPFVHLIGFRFLDGKNHLLNFDSPNPVRDGKPMRPLFIVGAKLWYAPEVAESHLFGILSGNITQGEREIDAKLDPDPISGLQGTIRFTLDKDQPRLTITSTLRNVGNAEKETSCWWPVSFEPGGSMEADVIPCPTEPTFSFHYWSYGGTASEPACKVTADKVTLDLDRPLEKSIFKIGFLGREIVVNKPDCAYRLTTLTPLPGPQHAYPHGGSPVMLYSDQKTWFCEAELSGPLVKLHPHEETSYTFSITLEKPMNKNK